MSKEKRKEELLTKEEALHLLSAQMRRSNIKSDELLKVVTLYSKICGWFDEPAPSKPEPTLEELIIEAEKKRRKIV